MSTHVSPAPSAAPAGPLLGPPPTGGPPDLMADAEPLTGSGIDDALGMLYAAMARERQTQASVGKAQVTNDGDEEQRALRKQEDAEDAERANDPSHGLGFFASIGHLFGDVTNDLEHLRLADAVNDTTKDVSDALHSPAFWNDLEQGALWVAKVAAVVGSVAATVATGGAAAATLAGAAVLLSVGGEVVTRTRMFGDASTAVGLGMDLAGCLGGGAACLLPSAASSATNLARVGVAATGFSGAATATAGAAHVENAGFASAAQSAAADATAATQENEQLQETVGWVVDEMKAQDKSKQASMQAVQDAIEANDRATAAAVPLRMKG